MTSQKTAAKETRIGLDVRILRPKQNLDYRSFFSLGRYVNEFIQIISFFEQSSFELKCDFSIIRAKLTLAFTLTILFPYVVVVSDLSKNIGGSTDLAK